MPPLTCCVLCSSPIWTCDPPWPSYYRGITLFSIKRVQRFCLFRIYHVNDWIWTSDPKVLSYVYTFCSNHIELHSANIINRMTTVRWLHLYPYYLLSSYRTSPTNDFQLAIVYFSILPRSYYQSFLNSPISGRSGRYPIWHMNYRTWYSLRFAVFGRYPQISIILLTD